MTGVKADVIRTFGDSRLRVYISGPMTGYPNLNRPAFAMAAEKVEAAGMIPVNPHTLCDPSWDWHRCMRADVAALCASDALLLLPGWEKSNGAQLELHIAHRLGLVVLTDADALGRYARGEA